MCGTAQRSAQIYLTVDNSLRTAAATGLIYMMKTQKFKTNKNSKEMNRREEETIQQV